MKPACVRALLVALAAVAVALAITLPIVLLRSDDSGAGSAQSISLHGSQDDLATDRDGQSDGGPIDFTIINVDAEAPAPLQLAVQACAGLYNREVGGSVYVRRRGEAEDKDPWLNELGLTPEHEVDAPAFLEECIVRFPLCVRYAYADQRELLPSVLTAAAALGAVPLDEGMVVAGVGSCDVVAFDAMAEFKDRNTPLLAARHVFERYVDQTTGLAMLNPGYDIWDDSNPSNPVIMRDMPSTMIDFIFSEKLFLVFLANGCILSHPEGDLLQDIVNGGNWSTPLGVYGYNNAWFFAGGFLYEALTLCLDSRNLGAIPTEADNLSFFSTRRRPIRDAEEIGAATTGRGEEDVVYDRNKTYVAFVVGDGDNVQYMMTTRREWFRRRLLSCERKGTAREVSCPALTWSISPHLARLAPDVLEWYYATSRQTGSDYFVLPPSGHLYAYPSSLAEDEQGKFAAATERDALLLGIGGTIHWDWFGTWRDAEEVFLPKYAREGGAIRAVFAMNVPYVIPPFPWWPSENFFEVLVGPDGGKLAVFRPRIWRGVDGRDGNGGAQYFLNPRSMAEELGGYPPGTVTGVYMTSDGGLTLENSFEEMVEHLPSHVELVSADEAAKLAFASSQPLS